MLKSSFKKKDSYFLILFFLLLSKKKFLPLSAWVYGKVLGPGNKPFVFERQEKNMKRIQQLLDQKCCFIP
jgi:hypothetical protein